ncbi:MAG: SHOCT domain-containing protein [Actinomycetota bacterium]
MRWDDDSMLDMMDAGMTWMMGFGFIFMIALLALVIAGFVWLLRNMSPRDRRDGKSGALSELEMRYARGDLDREDYLQRREDLLSRR